MLSMGFAGLPLKPRVRAGAIAASSRRPVRSVPQHSRDTRSWPPSGAGSTGGTVPAFGREDPSTRPEVDRRGNGGFRRAVPAAGSDPRAERDAAPTDLERKHLGAIRSGPRG